MKTDQNLESLIKKRTTYEEAIQNDEYMREQKNKKAPLLNRILLGGTISFLSLGFQPIEIALVKTGIINPKSEIAQTLKSYPGITWCQDNITPPVVTYSKAQIPALYADNQQPVNHGLFELVSRVDGARASGNISGGLATLTEDMKIRPGLAEMYIYNTDEGIEYKTLLAVEENTGKVAEGGNINILRKDQYTGITGGIELLQNIMNHRNGSLTCKNSIKRICFFDKTRFAYSTVTTGNYDVVDGKMHSDRVEQINNLINSIPSCTANQFSPQILIESRGDITPEQINTIGKQTGTFLICDIENTIYGSDLSMSWDINNNIYYIAIGLTPTGKNGTPTKLPSISTEFNSGVYGDGFKDRANPPALYEGENYLLQDQYAKLLSNIYRYSPGAVIMDINGSKVLVEQRLLTQ